MCLTIDNHLTAEFIEKYKDVNDKIEIYKVLAISSHEDTLVTPYQDVLVKPGTFKAKDLYSKYNWFTRPFRKFPYLQTIHNQDIKDGAIHVFLDLETTKYCTMGYYTRQPLKCTAKLKHLIGVGYFGDKVSAAFSKIYIPKSEYKRVIDIYA